MTSSTTIHISVVVIPSNETKLLESHQLSWDLNSSSDDNNKNNEGNSFRSNICSLLQDTDYLETPLLRPRGDDENQNFVATAGLYAYYNNARQSQNNIRATRLAMACGLLAKRFRGDVLLIRSFGYGTFEDLSVKEVLGACELSPDLRISTQQEMKIMMQTVNHHDDDDDDHDNDDDATCTISSPPPAWLLDAAQQNYHDGAAMAKVVSAFKTNDNDDDDDSSSDSDSSDDNDVDSHNKVECKATSTTTTVKASYSNEFIAKSPLCLHCRGPTDNLCGGCEGAYFCCSLSQENDSRLQSILCRDVRGWSHLCQCPTWRLYTNHRKQLSTFPYLGDWHKRLMTRDYQTQQHPYEQFLQQSLGVTYDSSSWWVTEMGGGWSGGHGDSAKIVDATIRLSYSEGFAPVQDIPSEERVDSELRSSGLDLSRNLVGLLSFKSWEDYYKLRGISSESPIALLCTFPLTVYHALERYGSVPITVAKMLKRPLRIHLVGVEKELNFLDLFKEIGFLLPEDIQVCDRVPKSRNKLGMHHRVDYSRIARSCLFRLFLLFTA